VRPLVLMNGHAHFNEVFFEDVRVPKANLVGPQNEGWKVAVTTLMFERSIAGGGNYKEQVQRLAALARQVEINGRPAWEQAWVRQKLAHLLIESESLKYTRLRSLTRQLKGLPPGPEGSMLKLCGSELGVRIAQFASEMLGDYAMINEPSEIVPDAPRWFNRLLSARQYTIAGGTSEIQHNIMGERVLGLPKG
jgi:alkylation response protein AidB-like acyl-CoA dehydrogenase